MPYLALQDCLYYYQLDSIHQNAALANTTNYLTTQNSKWI